MQEIYTWYGVGYGVWETEADSRHQGGVAVVWRAATGWKMENMARFGRNVVSFLLTSGARRWYVAGSYVPPNDGRSVHCVDQALQAASKGLEIIPMGFLNANLGDPRENVRKSWQQR